MQQTALILGGSGRFGRHMTHAFQQAGWATRQFDRKADTLWDAAWGAQVIVNGWNPPYPDWAAQVPRQIDQIVEVALASGATILQPGNVYGFGADAPQRFAEDTPHRARNPLGRVRIALETTLRQSGARTILLRAGDYLDTQASGNWFDRILTPSLAKGKLTYPGAPDVPHAWAFLPDVARAGVALANRRDSLARFEDVPFAGYTLTGSELALTLAGVVGHPVALSRMAWLPFQLSKPFWPMGKHLLEMRYLWDKPHYLDGAKLARLLPDYRDTSLEQALALALQHQVHPDKMVA
ncbi:epimerase [Actibacterium sp.]|uniref:epimerase n=1 Tax=Actibacterium sp. TaxID=1872125 RepID=UPI003563E41C